jgi:hypothetical protein
MCWCVTVVGIHDYRCCVRCSSRVLLTEKNVSCRVLISVCFCFELKKMFSVLFILAVRFATDALNLDDPSNCTFCSPYGSVYDRKCTVLPTDLLTYGRRKIMGHAYCGVLHHPVRHRDYFAYCSA